MDPGTAEIVVLERGADDPALCGRAYDSVLAPSFGTDELHPRDQYLVDVAGATMLVAIAGDEVVAAAVSETAEGEPIGLLSHLAVRPDIRASGLGGRMMATLRARWASGPAVVLGEVHDPRRWDERPDERPEARLRFYERHGARLLGVPWVQPRLWSGGDRVRDMLLLVMGGDPDRAVVPATWLRAWVVAYFAFTEGADAGDPTVAAMLERIGDDEVPIHPISALGAVAPLDA